MLADDANVAYDVDVGQAAVGAAGADVGAAVGLAVAGVGAVANAVVKDVSVVAAVVAAFVDPNQLDSAEL